MFGLTMSKANHLFHSQNIRIRTRFPLRFKQRSLEVCLCPLGGPAQSYQRSAGASGAKDGRSINCHKEHIGRMSGLFGWFHKDDQVFSPKGNQEVLLLFYFESLTGCLFS